MIRKLLILFLAAVCAQGAFEAVVLSSGPIGREIILEIAEKTNQSELTDTIESIYIDEGYLFVKVLLKEDSLKGKCFIDVIPGPLAVVKSYNIEGFIGEMPRLNIQEGKSFRRTDLNKDMDGLVSSLENNGYPFGETRIESLTISQPVGQEVDVRIKLVVSPGDSVNISAVIVPKGAKTKARFIEKKMLLRPSILYKQKHIDAGIKRLDDLEYLNISGAPEILLDETGEWALKLKFTEGRTVLINGILGYAPRSDKKGVSGQIDALFDNIWGTGRSLALNWNQSIDEYLKFKAKYVEPCIFGGFGDLSISAEYYERGSSYIERNFSFEYKHPINYFMSWSAGATFRSILPGTSGSGNIPKSSESRLTFGGYVEKLYPRVNPSKGWDLSLKTSPSYIERSVLELTSFSLDEYEALARIEGRFVGAQKIGRSLVFFEDIEGRTIFSKGGLALSDLYYLGGWGNLRGYREDQFSADNLGWSNSELRFLIGGEAHGFAFLDCGLIRPSGGDYEFKTGYGIGLRISTAIGRWTVAYGIAGGESLTSGLIHVGLVAEL
ncbi:BamA/TamA family outer membrane protein [bacterium]|nr:BamA/TamA family outer membrane protein [bacterium]